MCQGFQVLALPNYLKNVTKMKRFIEKHMFMKVDIT